MDRLENFKIQIALVIFAQIVALLALFIADFDGVRILPMIILVVFNISIVIWIVWRFQSDRKESDINISHILGHDAKDALSYGENQFNRERLLIQLENYMEEMKNE